MVVLLPDYVYGSKAHLCILESTIAIPARWELRNHLHKSTAFSGTAMIWLLLHIHHLDSDSRLLRGHSALATVQVA